jgi:hypothetical protein
MDQQSYLSMALAARQHVAHNFEAESCASMVSQAYREFVTGSNLSEAVRKRGVG